MKKVRGVSGTTLGMVKPARYTWYSLPSMVKGSEVVENEVNVRTRSEQGPMAPLLRGSVRKGQQGGLSSPQPPKRDVNELSMMPHVLQSLEGRTSAVGLALQ